MRWSYLRMIMLVLNFFQELHFPQTLTAGECPFILNACIEVGLKHSYARDK